MEQIIKNFKLIIGVLIIIFCALPFVNLPFIGDISGFGLFKVNILSFLAILLIVLGAAALIFVSLTKDIEIIPKFSLSRIAKLSVIVGIIFVFANLLTIIGIGLILVILIALALLYEDKIVRFFKK
jgi:hypothetical protein